MATMTRNTSTRPALRRTSTPERIISAGLATAACLGVVGLLGTRLVEAQAATPAADQAAATSVPVLMDSTEATTQQGLTKADLDAYAALLTAEKHRLDDYRAQLVKAAKQLQRPGKQGAGKKPLQVSLPQAAPAAPAAPAAKPIPVPQKAPAAAPAPQAQSQSHGS
jgi:cell division septation protein DedD